MSFANPQYLVETGWLAAHLDDPAVRVLECTVYLHPAPDVPGGYRVESGRAKWAEGHIPGAGFVDLHEIPFEPDAALLLCSDGLTDLIDSSAIQQIVARSAGRPQQVVKGLIDAANAAGGKDNVSVVYVEGERFAAVELPQEIEDGGRTCDLLHGGGRLPRVLYPNAIPVGEGPMRGAPQPPLYSLDQRPLRGRLELAFEIRDGVGERLCRDAGIEDDVAVALEFFP